MSAERFMQGRLFFRLIRGIFWDRGGLRVPWTVRRVVVMIGFVPVFLGAQFVHWLGFLLDELLFRGYRRIEVRQPMFIVGVPRSGTTLLHRVLAKDTQRFTTFNLGELLLAPSISERVFWGALGWIDRRLGRPVARLFAWLERSFLGGLDAIHFSSLAEPEEDYFALLPVFACFLLILPFPGSKKVWQLARFDTSLDADERRRIMAFYKGCLQRHLYIHGPDKILLSKNPSFTSMIGSLRETFPDCRVICNVRTPLETVPSLLSSMREGTRFFYGERHEDVLRDRLTDMVRHYYEHSLGTLPFWPPEQHVFVKMGDLEKQLQPTVERIYRRFELPLSEPYRAALEEEHRRALAYRSRHQYSLNEFGIDPSHIVEDHRYVFEYFDFGIPAAAARVRVG